MYSFTSKQIAILFTLAVLSFSADTLVAVMVFNWYQKSPLLGTVVFVSCAAGLLMGVTGSYFAYLIKQAERPGPVSPHYQRPEKNPGGQEPAPKPTP